MEESEYESLPTERVAIHLMAGAMAGVMEHCVMYPVDCVKVLIQSRAPQILPWVKGFLLDHRLKALQFACTSFMT
jgi:hypothetical protein